MYVMYENPSTQKRECSHKPFIVADRPISALQAEYSAYALSIQNNRSTATVKLEYTSKTTSQKRDEKEKLKIS